jgi:Ca2+-binding RTX toxin-like protein
MGSPVELKTVLSSARGTARKYEAMLAESSLLAKAAAGTLVLAGLALAKKLLFGTADAADLADDASTVEASGHASQGMEGADPADETSDSGSSAGESGKPTDGDDLLHVRPHGGSASDADFSDAPAPGHVGGLAVPHLRAGNDNGTAPVGSELRQASLAVARTQADGGSSGGGEAPDDRKRGAAPLVSAAAALRDAPLNQALLISLADLLQGVTDPDGDPLAIGNIISSSGHITANDDGTWTFTPAPNTAGEVSLVYEVTDGASVVLQTATVHVIASETTPGETVTGTVGPDQILTHDLADVVDAAAGDDVVYTAAGADRIEGGSDNDRLFGGDGDDIIFGGSGDDFISAGNGNDRVSGGSGADRMYGDRGNDVLAGGGDDDVIIAGVTPATEASATAEQSDGNDICDGGTGIDTYDASSITSALLIDLSNGTASGQGIGSDTLISVENVIGGSGQDTIVDSGARNLLIGGAGADEFCFTGLDQHHAGLEEIDQIRDFEAGDRINVSRVDANGSDNAIDKFEFLGELAPNSSISLTLKQLAYRFEARSDGEHTFIYGRTNEVDDYGFAVDLVGHHSLISDDFIGLA